MAESAILNVIRVWAAVAWADGKLAPAEAEALRRLIRGAVLTDAERILAGRMIDAQVAMPEAFLATLSEDARHGIYRAACKMAVLDQKVAISERRVLTRLRTSLSMTDADALAIEAEVPGLEP